MKHFFVLILPCVFTNVLAESTDSLYIEMVAITNKHIQLAADHNHDSLGNGLEYVISEIVDEDELIIETMCLMITVPELAYTDSLDDQKESLLKQELMQTEISKKTSIPVPDAFDDTTLNLEDLNLFSLGHDRRILTREALKNIILRKLVVAEFQPRISSIGEMYRVFKMCNLLALWWSTYTAFLTLAMVDNPFDRICILSDEVGQVTKYRCIEGKYYQVDNNDVDITIISLEQQLGS